MVGFVGRRLQASSPREAAQATAGGFDAIQEMKALRQERETHLATIEQLKAFEVSQSRFYRLKDTTTGDPIIELTGKNGTPHAVSSVYFEGTLSSTGRSVPWLQETFDHNVPGGIEPGEQAT